MKKRIRIRKTLLGAVFAGAIVMALAPTAGAAQLTGDQRSGSNRCSIDPRIAAHESHLCSSQLTTGDERSGSNGCSIDPRIAAHESYVCSSQDAGSVSVADEIAEVSTSSTPTNWLLYVLGAFAIAAAATFSALRWRPQAVR